MHNPFDPGYYESEQLRSFGFKAIGENVRVAKNCTIIGLENIEIGDHCRVDSRVHLIAGTGYVRLGRYIHIGGGCQLAGRGGIEMGDFSGLSQDVKIYSASDDYSGRHMTNPTVPAELTGCHVEKVNIGRHAIIGSGSVVLPGCHLGEGVAVGALSLVTKRLDPWGIFSGNPARLIKTRSQRATELEALLIEHHPSRTP